jgi:hypothetical protein
MGDRALADYTLAASVDPSDQTAYLAIANTDFSLGESANTLKALQRAGQGIAVCELKVESNLQLGHFTAAADATGPLVSPDSSDSNLHLAGLALAAANQTAAAQVLVPRITAIEAATSVQRATTDKMALAQELYVTGLLNASEAVLQPQPAGFERNVLLARILYRSNQKSDLALAANLLETAVYLNPSDISAHRLLAEIYKSEGQTSKASTQDSLISRLSFGQP